MLRITLVLFIVGGAVAQIELPKSCPNFKTVQNFDLQRYMGNWYEFAKYMVGSGMQDKCVTATHSMWENGWFEITYTQTLLGGDFTYSYNMPAVPISDPHHGKFTMTSGGTPYWVLATDYTRWALVSSCTNLTGESLRSAWIYTRAQNPSDQVIDAVYAALLANNVDLEYFVLTNQEGCPDCY